jgi:DNA-binding HxlR family transcriptional regulator
MKKTTKQYPAPGKAPDIFYQPAKCPVRNVLGLLGRKWPSLILCHLSFGSHRFSELRGAIPDISQRMLSQTLRGLERDGIISRETRGGVPPRVDYALTPLGESYIEPLQNLLSWGAKHQGRIDIIRRAYDAETAIETAS